MKVLVTGASGFLGGWLVHRLVDEGHDVRIIRRSTSHLDEIKGLALETREGDITNAESLVEACRDVECVFHLAGLIAYTRAQRDAMERINVEGTRNVVEACVSARVRRLIHLSSVVAIGASLDGKAPLNEESPYELQPFNLGYFETKRTAEQIVRSAVTDGRLDAVMINPSTIYGAADAKKGSRSVQVKVARGQFPFYTRGGVNVVAVEDVIHCIVEAVNRGRAGERYIVAGENITIRELFTMIAEEAGVTPPTILLPNFALSLIGKLGDGLEAIGVKGPINSENAITSTLYHWFDASKARRELGLDPRPARQAIANSVGWMRENGLLARPR